jgi:hypothetical protein
MEHTNMPITSAPEPWHTAPTNLSTFSTVLRNRNGDNIAFFLDVRDANRVIALFHDNDALRQEVADREADVQDLDNTNKALLTKLNESLTRPSK